ncbi:carbohydrate-binding protein [Thermococcus sp. JCM 11816]|uniref:carbohydrate-binding protein n=1 Tax=Thermococcus sp. (strain JCM 11816 / KS-1) TaxID=1295125 RepID=UPI000AB5811F
MGRCEPDLEPVQQRQAYEVYRSTDPSNLFSPNNLLVVVNWSSYPKYEPGKTYNQGDVVEYNGKIWRVKYWTQSVPGSDDSWELVGDVVPTTSYLDQYHLKANTTYYYGVVPVLADGSRGGSPSNVLAVTTPPLEPYRVIVYYISWGKVREEVLRERHPPGRRLPTSTTPSSTSRRMEPLPSTIPTLILSTSRP